MGYHHRWHINRVGQYNLQMEGKIDAFDRLQGMASCKLAYEMSMLECQAAANPSKGGSGARSVLCSHRLRLRRKGGDKLQK